MKVEVDVSNEDIKNAVIREIVKRELRDIVYDELKNTAIRPLVKEVVRENIEDALRRLDLVEMKKLAIQSIETQMKYAIKKALATVETQDPA